VGPPNDYTTFDLSADARRIVASERGGSGRQLWAIDAGTGATTRVTLGDETDVDPRWSPDGRAVIFGSSRGPARAPFRVGLDGGDPEPVMTFAGRIFSLDDWSRDGRWLLFHDAGVPLLQARRIDDSDGEAGKSLTVARALTGTIDQGAMSPDGRWIAYNSNESGRYEVIVVPFPPTGDKVLVSRSGGFQPTWRADGGELYFLDLEGTLMAAPVGRGTPTVIGEPAPLFRTALWLRAFEVEQYAPNPDGSRFLLLDDTGRDRTATLGVITNWRALVESK
jgi:Tol biopolymer transport system component